MGLSFLPLVLAWRQILNDSKAEGKVLAGALCPLVSLQPFPLPRAEPTLNEHPASCYSLLKGMQVCGHGEIPVALLPESSPGSIRVVTSFKIPLDPSLLSQYVKTCFPQPSPPDHPDYSPYLTGPYLSPPYPTPTPFWPEFSGLPSLRT